MRRMSPNRLSADDLVVTEIRAPVDPRKKVAYCVNLSALEILVSNSGHGTILRGRDKRDIDFGGWVDVRTRRIWETNGTVKNVPGPLRGAIAGALGRHFEVTFRWPQG